MSDTREKHAEIIRKLIEHENTVQNLRFTWFMGSEGFLFAALGFAWEKGTTPLVIIVAATGFLIAASAFVAVRLSEKAYVQLNEWWKANLGDYSGPPRNGYDLRDVSWKWGFLLPQNALPCILATAWVIVIFHRVWPVACGLP